MAQDFGQRSLDAPALRTYLERESGQPLTAWPLVRWDRRMLTLAAGFYSPALAGARAQVQAAQGGVDVADTTPNPVLDFPFEYELHHQGEGRPFTTGPMLTWTVETAGKRAARVDQAMAQRDAARANLLDQAWKIRSQLRAALLGVHTEARRIEALSAKAAQVHASVEMLDHRLHAGAIALPDARRMGLQASQADAELTAAQVALDGARARLATAVGIPVGALDGIVFDTTDFERVAAAPAQADARRAAILGRADLRAALADYDAGEAALRQEVARQYPDIHLGTGYTYDAGANKISFGLGGITLPVFDTNRGAIAQAQARRDELAARVQGLQAAILNDVDAGVVRYRAAIAERERSARQLASAARQRDSVAASFKAGGADRLELAQANVDFQAFLLDDASARAALQEAAAQLEDAMQQPLGANPENLP